MKSASGFRLKAAYALIMKLKYTHRHVLPLACLSACHHFLLVANIVSYPVSSARAHKNLLGVAKEPVSGGNPGASASGDIEGTEQGSESVQGHASVWAQDPGKPERTPTSETVR